MRLFGLIGKTLKHSFSKKYFSSKFESEQIKNAHYELFELSDIKKFPALISEKKTQLKGLNVTIPYKQEVMQYLDELDEKAAAIDAVNTIKVMPNGHLKGYNTDYFGFKNSLSEWDLAGKKALVLGTGGASKAVTKALTDLGIPFLSISRTSSKTSCDYNHINSESFDISSYLLIINATPLGTFPNVDEKPVLPYDQLTKAHYLFDLVYNPEVTAFMKAGIAQGAQVKNGYSMLVGQAEAAWEIWNA